MTIEKGRAWGVPGCLGIDEPVARSDRDVARLVDNAIRSDTQNPRIGLLGGDLARTVGARGTEARLREPGAVALPMDLGEVLIDGRLHRFVAHLVARRSWWRGPVLVAMNAQWMGDWNVAPKSHPNDGLIEVLDGDPSFDDRLKARSRLRTGTHLPHPNIRVRRLPAVQCDFGTPRSIWLDGERVAEASKLSIRVAPDTWTAVI